MGQQWLLPQDIMLVKQKWRVSRMSKNTYEGDVVHSYTYWLQNILMAHAWRTWIIYLACIGPQSSVDVCVRLQLPALCEWLPTLRTQVWANLSMALHMLLQIRCINKRFATHLTTVRANARMDKFMLQQQCFVTVWFTAQWTKKRLLSFMYLLMISQVGRIRECLPTYSTTERFYPKVNTFMSQQMRFFSKCFRTIFASKWFSSRVRFLVTPPTASVNEALWTVMTCIKISLSFFWCF